MLESTFFRHRLVAISILLSLQLSRHLTDSIRIVSKLGPCSADTDQGTIDLSPIANKDGTARFTNIISQSNPDDISYDWNPCYDFSETAQALCQSVAFCVLEGNSPAYDSGLQASAEFSSNGSHVTLSYSDEEMQSSASFILTCSSGESVVKVVNDIDISNSIFQLESPYACPQIKKGAISVGTILCISFFASLALYFIIGGLFAKFVKKSTATVPVIHEEFWKRVLLNAKEGVLCSLQKMRLRRAGYDNV